MPFINIMPTYELGYNQYKFVIRTDKKKIEVYKGMWREKILEKLPEDITWEGIDKIFSKKDHEKDVSDLISKLFEFYIEN